MIDHLPECADAMIPDFHNERWVCICAALRACEQRVLNEAREAVAASGGHSDRCICDECYGTAAALAAIDALREEQK